jgi:preprotein translocase subunit SecF
MNIIKHKNFYFLLSAIVIIPGLISLFLFGLKLSIDFTGGSKLTIAYSDTKTVTSTQVKNIFTENKIEVHAITAPSINTLSIRSAIIDQKTKEKIVAKLVMLDSEIIEEGFDTVGPTIGKEAEANALKAVLIASLAITLFIALAFRGVSYPVASWKFGLIAVAALLHDVLVVVGVFSILGKVFGVEIDALFITALLTVMGFSVHDTIVVFDRIRENLKRHIGMPFETIVSNSIMETFNRSLNTSFTVVLVLFSLLLFGGEGIRWFVVALLVGMISGTYSSIFTASPLLVVWHEWDKRKKNKKT